MLVARFAEPREARIIGGRRGAEAAHRIAAVRVFDLDHFGTEFTEDRRGERGRDERREVEHANAVERPRRPGGV